MLQAIKTMASRYNSYMTYVGRKRALEFLLNSSDRVLEDAGFSRVLLEKGVQAWPWRAEQIDVNLQPAMFDASANDKAVQELRAYSEKELHDLGISRGSIEDVVHHGRPGIERDDRKKVA